MLQYLEKNIPIGRKDPAEESQANYMAAIPKKPHMSDEIEMEEAPRHNQQRPRPYIEKCSDIVAFINAEQKVTYISPSITSIMGYSPEEIVGCYALALVHPDDLN